MVLIALSTGREQGCIKLVRLDKVGFYKGPKWRHDPYVRRGKPFRLEK